MERTTLKRRRPIAAAFTEAEIRAALDGTFSHVFGWKETVPIDFIPSHQNIYVMAARVRWPIAERR